jgi:hypothetical protein
MQKLELAFSLLKFLFHNWIIVQNLGINFFQNFFKKIFRNSKNFFLNFLFILKKKGTFDVIFFSIIFSKNYTSNGCFICLGEKKKIFQELLIEFFLCSPKRLNIQIEIILKHFLSEFYIRKDEIPIFLKFISKKLNKKMILENRCEFSLNMMKIMEIFILNFTCIYSKTFKFFSFIFFKILTGIKIEYLNENFNNSFNYVIQILTVFKERKFNSISKKYFQSLLNMFIFLSFRSTNPSKVSKINKLRIQEKIFRLIIELRDELEGEYSYLIPIFLNFGFLSSKVKRISISKNLFAFLFTVLNSIQSVSLFGMKNFEEILLITFVFLNFLEKKTISSQKCWFNFFSFEEKPSFIAKISLCADIFNSLSFLRRNIIYSKISNIQSFSPKGKVNPTVNMLFLIFLAKKIKGSCFSGNFLTFWLKNQGKIFKDIFDTMVKTDTLDQFFYLIDFLNLFRYQVPIRLIFRLLRKIFSNQNTGFKANSHLLNYIEKTFCQRGNDGSSIIMIYVYPENLIYLKQTLEKILKEKKILHKRLEIVFKITFRFFLIYGVFLHYSEFQDKRNIDLFFEKYFFKNKNKTSYLYLAETILIATNNKKEDKIFSEKILYLAEYMFLPEFYDFLPFYFQFFSIIDIMPHKMIFLKILNRLMGIAQNRLFWISKYYPISLNEFLISILKRSDKIVETEHLSTFLTIFEIYLKKFGFDENLLEFLFQLLNQVSTFTNFIPRLLEIFKTENLFDNLEFRSIVIFILDKFIIENSTEMFFNETQKLGKNFLFFLITSFYFKRFSSRASMDSWIPFYLSEKFLKSAFFSPNFIGRYFRKIIIELKNQKIIQKIKNKNFFHSSYIKNRKKFENNQNFEKIYKIMQEYCRGKNFIINFYNFKFN